MEHKLETIQNKILKIIVKAFKIVVIEIIKIKIGILPIYIILDKL